MKNLFYYSRVVSLVILISAIVLIVSYFPGHIFWWYRLGCIDFSSSIVLPSISYITVLCFFILIYVGSVKGSNLRTPTLIGIISVAVAICALFISLPFYSEGMYVADMLIGLIASIGILWGFKGLSKYMSSKKLKVLCMTYSILNIVSYMGILLAFRLYTLAYNSFWQILFIIQLCVLSVFYYAFSKNINN